MRLLDLRRLPSFKAGSLFLRKSDLRNLAEIKADLTYHARRYVGEDKQGRPIMESHISGCGYVECDTHLMVPREYPVPDGVEVLDIAPPGRSFSHMEDRVTSFLDDDQEAAWVALEASEGGLVHIPGGRGKTILAIKKIVQRGKEAIIILPTLSIVHNWMDELKSKGGIRASDIGFFQGQNFDELEKPIVIASLKSLSRKAGVFPYEVRTKFGTVVVDEAHHLGSATHQLVASMFWGKRFGFTAEVTRGDNTTPLVYHHLGPTIYESYYHSLTPTVRFKLIPSDLTDKSPELIDRRRTFNFQKLWSILAKDPNFNAHIFKDVEWYLAQDRVPMVFTHKPSHADFLQKEFTSKGVQTGIITGKINWKKRQTELLTNDLVVGTLGAAREGLNKLQLDLVLLTMPTGRRAKGRFLQAIWRALRDVEGKTRNPLVIVYVPDLDPCRALAEIMRRFAEERGYFIERFESGVGAVQTVSTSRKQDTDGVRSRKRKAFGSVPWGRPGGA